MSRNVLDEPKFYEVPGYENPYGRWKVTTEGDEEGKTTKDLGTYEGYIDEIAFYLADKSYYQLRFKSVKSNSGPYIPKRDKVVVGLDIDSKSWDKSPAWLANEFATWLQGRGVNVEAGGGYAAVTLHLPPERKHEILRERARRKIEKAGLTDEELRAYLDGQD